MAHDVLAKVEVPLVDQQLVDLQKKRIVTTVIKLIPVTSGIPVVQMGAKDSQTSSSLLKEIVNLILFKAWAMSRRLVSLSGVKGIGKTALLAALGHFIHLRCAGGCAFDQVPLSMSSSET